MTVNEGERCNKVSVAEHCGCLCLNPLKWFLIKRHMENVHALCWALCIFLVGLGQKKIMVK